MPETVAELRGGELALLNPEILPGGNAILFAADNPGPVDKTTIEVVTLADRQRKTVVQGGASPRYLATGNGAGHLLYVNQATLFAIPFDLNTLTTRGTAVPVVDDVAHETQGGVGQFDVSRTGTLVYRKAIGGASVNENAAMGGRHRQEGTAAGQAWRLPESQPVTGRHADRAGGLGRRKRGHLGLRHPSGRHDAPDLRRSLYRFPRWSPDGRRVIFSSVGNGIFEARADGASQPQALMSTKVLQRCGVVHAGW